MTEPKISKERLDWLFSLKPGDYVMLSHKPCPVIARFGFATYDDEYPSGVRVEVTEIGQLTEWRDSYSILSEMTKKDRLRFKI